MPRIELQIDAQLTAAPQGCRTALRLCDGVDGIDGSIREYSVGSSVCKSVVEACLRASVCEGVGGSHVAGSLRWGVAAARFISPFDEATVVAMTVALARLSTTDKPRNRCQAPWDPTKSTHDFLVNHASLEHNGERHG
jgi:hypothetical protein